MKRNILKLILISSCCVCLCGCGNQTIPEENNSLIVEPTEEELKEETIHEVKNEEVEVETETKEEIGENISFESNKEYEIDLNNDGVKEKILYYVEGDFETDENSATHLIVNDIDYTDEIDLFAPIDTFHIIDVDKNDDFLELLISTYGMSDDLESEWFRYDGEKLVNLGYSEMIPGEGIIINDDSTLTIYNRTDIMETSFIPVKYKIENNKIVKAQEDGDLYEWETFREGLLTNKIDLVVRTDRNNEAETFVIPANSQVDSNTTDNIEWANIIYNDTEYWLHIIDFQLVDNNNAYVYETFDNLFLAD